MEEEIMNTELIPYSLEQATIEALKSKYLDVTIKPDDKAAYAMVMAGLRECRDIRTDVDAWHKVKKEWIVKAGNFYDTERRRVKALVAPIEEHLDAVRKIEDDRKAAIKAEKEQVERDRVATIRARIFDIMMLASNLTGKTAPELQQISEALFDTNITKEVYQEFTDEAERVKMECLDAALKARETRITWEQEEAARKVEAERLEKQRKEQQDEAQRLAEEKVKLELERKADEDRRYREQILRNASERAEKEAREKLEREERERKEKEEAEAKEKERKAAQAPDKEKLLAFADELSAVKAPEVISDPAQVIVGDVSHALRGVIAMIRKEAGRL
jgi:hypothetical protein